MFAVKGFADRLGHAALLEIIGEHRRPSNGLKYCPMTANPREKRGDDEQMADTTKHRLKMKRGLGQVKNRRAMAQLLADEGAGSTSCRPSALTRRRRYKILK